MEKTEKYPQNIIGNILIYDDKNIQYYHCVPLKIGSNQDYAEFYVSSEPFPIKIPTNHYLTATVGNFEHLDNITLDDTTMKRIAKYNKEVDIKKLEKEIEEKKKKIDELDSILQDREDRVGKLKKYIADIYNLNLDEDDEGYDYYD